MWKVTAVFPLNEKHTLKIVTIGFSALTSMTYNTPTMFSHLDLQLHSHFCLSFSHSHRSLSLTRLSIRSIVPREHLAASQFPSPSSFSSSPATAYLRSRTKRSNTPPTLFLLPLSFRFFFFSFFIYILFLSVAAASLATRRQNLVGESLDSWKIQRIFQVCYGARRVTASWAIHYSRR